MDLSTSFALAGLLFACISAIGALFSGKYALALDEATQTLDAANRRVKVQADRISLLEGRIDRLTGRVYSQARKPRAEDEERGGVDAPSRGDIEDIDPELAAELALQSAPPVAPGKRN